MTVEKLFHKISETQESSTNEILKLIEKAISAKTRNDINYHLEKFFNFCFFSDYNESLVFFEEL